MMLVTKNNIMLSSSIVKLTVGCSNLDFIISCVCLIFKFPWRMYNNLHMDSFDIILRFSSFLKQNWKLRLSLQCEQRPCRASESLRQMQSVWLLEITMLFADALSWKRQFTHDNLRWQTKSIQLDCFLIFTSPIVTRIRGRLITQGEIRHCLNIVQSKMAGQMTSYYGTTTVIVSFCRATSWFSI